MRERRHGLGLALEPRQRLRVARDLLRKDLDRDLAVQPRVPRLPDLSHATRPKRRQDLIGTQPGYRALIDKSRNHTITTRSPSPSAT